MMTITINRFALGMPNLTINDSGSPSDTYTLMREYDSGEVEYDNTIAKSRWRDGGTLTSSRKEMSEIVFTVKVDAGSLSQTVAAIRSLREAVGQWGYEVYVDEGGQRTTYTCMPANTRRAHDPVLMRSGADYVTVTIPRQP